MRSSGSVEACFELRPEKKTVGLRVRRIIEPVECVDATAAAYLFPGPPTEGLLVPARRSKRLWSMFVGDSTPAHVASSTQSVS
jgi:hypothetical protein